MLYDICQTCFRRQVLMRHQYDVGSYCNQHLNSFSLTLLLLEIHIDAKQLLNTSSLTTIVFVPVDYTPLSITAFIPGN